MNMTARVATDAFNDLIRSESDRFAVERLSKAVLTLEDERDEAIVDWREAVAERDHSRMAYRRAVSLYKALDGELDAIQSFVDFHGGLSQSELNHIRGEWDEKRRAALREAENEAEVAG